MALEDGLGMGEVRAVALQLILEGDGAQKNLLHRPVQAHLVFGLGFGEELKAALAGLQQGLQGGFGGQGLQGLAVLVNGADISGLQVKGGGGNILHVPSFQGPLLVGEKLEELLEGQCIEASEQGHNPTSCLHPRALL